MRESLTVLAGILVLILSAALAVPYLIDWSAQRGLVEKQLSDVLGRPVTIRGGIDLKLLPTPYVRLADVDIGSAAAKPEVKAEEIQLEIALTALLRGEVDFVEAKLVRPQVELAIADGDIQLGLPLRRFAGPMRFERISVEDGTLALADPAVKRNYRLDHISFSAEAGSLTGPFKADGWASYAGVPTRFRLGTGDLARNETLHVKLILDENAQHPRADLDADLQFAKARLPSLDGQLVLAGHGQMPWQLSAHVAAALRQAAFDTIDLRIGDEDHGFDLTGSADVDLGAAPAANAVLKGGQIDLDRLLSGNDAPPALQKLVEAGAALVKSNDGLQVSLPVHIEVAADTVILGAETWTELSAGLGLSNAKAMALRFAASGPGRSHLALDGKLETGDAAGFTGHVAARAADVAGLRQWLTANLPQSGAALAVLPVQSFEVSGDGNISAVGFVGRNLALRLDAARFAGTLAYTQAVGSEAARLFADLTADRLDLASLPDLAGFAARAAGTDLSLRLDARSVNIGSLDIGGGPTHSEQGLTTGRIQLRLEKTGKLAKLEHFAVTALGGAHIEAYGQWDGQKGTLAGTLDSDKLDAAAELLQRLAPGPWSDLLVARAGALVPAHLTLNADVAGGDKGVIQGAILARSDLGGTLGGTKISAHVVPNAQDPQTLDVGATAKTPDILAFLRQLGIATLPLGHPGAGEVTLTASGKPDQGFATKLTASLAGSNLSFEGRVDGDLAAPQAHGMLHLASADLTALLEATGLAFPDPAARLPADLQASVAATKAALAFEHLSGRLGNARIAGHLAYEDGRVTGALDADRLSFAQLAALALGPLPAAKQARLWSNAKFAPAMLDPPVVSLAVTAKAFDLWPQWVGRDARFDLDLSGGRSGFKLALGHLAMKIASGHLGGDITLRRDGANAAATARLNLADYDLILPSLRGRLAANIDMAGTGTTPEALITGLAGSGTVSLSDFVLPRTDPAALLRVFQAAEDDALTLDVSEIERALSREFDKGAAHLGSMAFDAGLAGGMLRLTANAPAKRLEPGVDESLQMSLDLTTLALDQRSRLTLLALPKDWSGPPPVVELAATGPLADPQRSIQSAAFVNALAARAIARESARIQAQEFDIHEQGFFYNRLTFERRSDEERVRVAEEARRAAAAKAEAAAKAKAEAEAKAREAKDQENPQANPEPAPNQGTAGPSATNVISTKPEAGARAPANTEVPSVAVQKLRPGEAQAKVESEIRTAAPATPLPVARPSLQAQPPHTTPMHAVHSLPLHPSQAHKPVSVVRRQPKPQAQTPAALPVQQAPKPFDPLAAGRF